MLLKGSNVVPAFEVAPVSAHADGIVPFIMPSLRAVVEMLFPLHLHSVFAVRSFRRWIDASVLYFHPSVLRWECGSMNVTFFLFVFGCSSAST